jgi:hypothetical protein
MVQGKKGLPQSFSFSMWPMSWLIFARAQCPISMYKSYGSANRLLYGMMLPPAFRAHYHRK